MRLLTGDDPPKATRCLELFQRARRGEDGFRYALIRGVLYRMSPSMARHGRIGSAIDWHLRGFVAARGLGAVYNQSGFILERDPDVLLEPDLAFVQASRVPADEDAYPPLAPELVVEVTSPSQTGPSIEEKVALYLAAGVRLIWAVDPAKRTVHVRRADGTDLLLGERDTLLGEDVLSGFQLVVAELIG